MDNKRIIRNIGVSMVMKPIGMILSLIYTPLALAFLGDEKYGVWAVILNIVSWINYFDIGIGNGLRNRLAEAVVLEDENLAETYVSTAYAGTAVISAVFFLFINLVWNVFNLTGLFNLSTPDENTDLVIFISVFFVCVNFILSLSKTCAYSIQQPGIISVVGVIGQVLQIGIILMLAHIFNHSLAAAALMYGIVSLFDSVAVYIFVTAKRKYLAPSITAVDMHYMKPLLTLGAGFFVLQICSLVLNTTDNLLISNLYGSADVTPYSIVYKVFYMAVQVHGIIIMPMWSAYTEAAARRDMGWIRKTMKRVNFVSLLLSAAAIVGIFLFRPVAAIWLRRELEYSNGLIITVAVYMAAQMFGNNYSSFLCGVGHIKTSVIVSAAGAVINIPLSVLFAQTCGMKLTGIILGSLSVMLASVVVLPIVADRWLKVKTLEWGEEADE